MNPQKLRVTEFITLSIKTQAKFHTIMKKWYKIFNEGPVSVHSPEEMTALGEQIGALLEGGEILALVGNLGAGKTHLTQGIMKGLGSSHGAVSPTFSLVHEHRDGRHPASHFDFYRLKHEEELSQIDWEDYLSRGDILIVEWADMFPDALPHTTEWLLIEHKGPEDRLVTLHQAN